MIEIIYIGNKFYRESGTVMSSIYEIVDGGVRRSDWGFVQAILENGEEIYLRPATQRELEAAETHLKEIKAHRNA